MVFVVLLTLPIIVGVFEVNVEPAWVEIFLKENLGSSFIVFCK